MSDERNSPTTVEQAKPGCPHVRSWMDPCASCRDKSEIARLRSALEEIAEGRGRYSRDPMTHACNTIDDMKAAAKAALSGTRP